MIYEDLKYDMEEELFYSKEDFLTRKAKKGNADAMYLLGVLYFEGDQPEEAYSWFTKAAKKGQPDATYYLGNFYGHPKGFDLVEPNEQTMIEYWSKAADLGSPLAMCELGRRYRQGWGIEKNEAKAIELFEKAAELGYHEAFFWLSKCYKNGGGVEQNIEKAFEYAQKAYDALSEEMI